jgi:hypothetical protein
MMKTKPHPSDALDFDTIASASSNKRRKSVQFAYPLVVGTYERPKATREEKLVLYWSERDISEFRDNYIRVDMLCNLSGLDPNITNNNIGRGSCKVPEMTTASVSTQQYPHRKRAADPVQHDEDITSHHVFLLRDMFLFTDSLFHVFSKERQQQV